MKVNLLKNNLNFTARLFDKNNNEIKSFDPIRSLMGENDIAKNGSPNTDIFVKDFISTKDSYGAYDNEIKLGVSNPLFGYQEFNYYLAHKSNKPVKNDKYLEYSHMELLDSYKTDHFKSLEDIALKQSLVDNILSNTNSHDTKKLLNPINILENMLQNTSESQHGFNKTRIDDFKNIANNLFNDILEMGIEQLKKQRR